VFRCGTGGSSHVGRLRPDPEIGGNVLAHMHRASRSVLATIAAAVGATAALAGCGGGAKLIAGPAPPPAQGVPSKAPDAPARLGFPTIATKNTNRVAGADPIADAVGVALAVYPSAGGGTHPAAVVLAPTDDWQASIAASILMAPPIKAPLLLSGPSSLPSATAGALKTLAPTGSGAVGGNQLIRVGDVPSPSGYKSAAIKRKDPYALAAAIDQFASAATSGKPSADVVIASGDNAPYAMPAAGWAAESGDPILFVTKSAVPEPTRQALLAHQHPNIYVVGPASVIPDSILTQLRRYGKVKRIAGADPSANSVAFTIYRDPPCTFGQPCAHVPGSFGWAMRSPGHGYTLLNDNRPLDAAASAALSASGSYGPQLLIDNPSKLSPSVLNYFLDYATPGYTQEGPTAAVYNHGWMIGDTTAISVPVQAEVDALLEVVPQK
jgi:hypothetical protein